MSGLDRAFGLQGKTVLVTGSTRRIGLAIAQASPGGGLVTGQTRVADGATLITDGN